MPLPPTARSTHRSRPSTRSSARISSSRITRCALTDGEDAQSEAIVKIRVGGSDELVTGRGVSVDVMEASIKAYINGINKYFND